MTIRCKLNSEQDTESFARVLHDVLPTNVIVALDGTLGAGKTRLVRAFAVASGVAAESVTSPTFTLWQTYEGDRVIHHLDAYRIGNEDEFDALGVEDCFDAEATTFVEWANRVEQCLPKTNRVQIQIDVLSHNERMVNISSQPDLERVMTAALIAKSLVCEPPSTAN